jgi:hypothetical protein
MPFISCNHQTRETQQPAEESEAEEEEGADHPDPRFDPQRVDNIIDSLYRQSSFDQSTFESIKPPTTTKYIAHEPKKRDQKKKQVC